MTKRSTKLSPCQTLIALQRALDYRIKIVQVSEIVVGDVEARVRFGDRLRRYFQRNLDITGRL